MARPCVFEPADQREQPLDVGVRRLLVGSSSTTTRAPLARARATSTSCCAAGDRSATERVGADLRMTELRQRVGRRLAHAPPVDQAVASRLHPQADVLHHRQMRRERQLLVNHRDAGAARVDRLARLRTASRRGVIAPASGRIAPDRIAISVLLPAPFCPTSAHTSPGATAKSTPSTATGRAERLAHAAHLEARRGRPGYFSHFERSGLSSSFIAGSFMFSLVAM